MNKRHKVLALTRYHDLGASSRIRFFKYENLLSQKGFEVTYQSLLPNSYIKSLYDGEKQSSFKLLFYYFKRLLFLIFKGRKFDVVWIEKELFPEVPTFFEKAILSFLPKYILDYDDSVHLNYKNKNFGRKNKIEKLMASANSIFAGSPYLKEVALNSGALSVVSLPTPVELQKKIEPKEFRFNVGWVGSPSTEKYLLKNLELFKVISKEIENIKFIFVGARSKLWKEMTNVELVPWSESLQEEKIQEFDLGIMPLENTLWEKGKCSYKLLLYMSAGVPVIASQVGMNEEVVSHGKNGYLVSTDNEWREYFHEFKQLSQKEKYSMGEFSMEVVRKSYTYDVTVDIIEKSFLNLIGEIS